MSCSFVLFAMCVALGFSVCTASLESCRLDAPEECKQPLPAQDVSSVLQTMTAFGTDKDMRCRYEKKSVLVENLHTVFKKRWAAIARQTFAKREGPVIMIAGYQRESKVNSSDHTNLKYVLGNFLSNANRAAHDGSGFPVVIHINLNRASYDMCKSAPTLAHLHVECVNLANWFEHVGEPECFSFPIILWARSVIYSEAVSVSHHGVLLLGMDVLLHGNLIDWIKQNKRDHSSIMSSTAWGLMNDGVPARRAVCNGSKKRASESNITCACGDILFADRRSSDFVAHWVANNKNFLDSAYGDQDSLNDLIVNRGWHERLEIIPPQIAGQCGYVGQYATHYNCKKEKIKAMKKNGDWLM